MSRLGSYDLTACTGAGRARQILEVLRHAAGRDDMPATVAADCALGGGPLTDAARPPAKVPTCR